MTSPTGPDGHESPAQGYPGYTPSQGYPGYNFQCHQLMFSVFS